MTAGDFGSRSSRPTSSVTLGSPYSAVYDALTGDAANEADDGIVSSLPTAANFVSCVLPAPAVPAMAALEKRGIFVRDWRDPEYLRELRIGVGTPDDTDATLQALRDYVVPQA